MKQAPGSFLIDARVNRVKALLLTSGLTLERIAELCGYSTVQFMCRQFKERTGTTPGKFRTSGV